MDKTTTWLIRVAAALVIGTGLFGEIGRVSHVRVMKRKFIEDTARQGKLFRMKSRSDWIHSCLTSQEIELINKRITREDKDSFENCVNTNLKEGGFRFMDWEKWYKLEEGY